ncbi:MAG: sugar phosphate isomerase/epimerase [Opitutae bacterium]|nr:sugar phosphate isomerase/epimerase [Opitutae bacterium]
MIKSAITVSLVAQAKGGPFVYWDGLEAAAAAAANLGFDAIEIFAPSASAVNRTGLQVLLKKHGLKAAAFGTGGGWLMHKWHLTHADLVIRSQAREFIRAIIDLGGEFQAPAIIGSMQGKAEGDVSREQALAWLGEALADLGPYAQQYGVPLLYEPLNRYETNLLNRQLDAAQFLEQHQISNVKLLCDLFHMNIEEVSSAVTLRACGGHVGHIHFADSNRQAIGWGHTDAAAVIAALKDIGFEGYLSGEILPLPNSTAAAAQTIKAIRAHLPR